MKRNNLSVDLADVIRRWILEGEAPPGTHLNEVRIADRLEVSRTPVREALSRLAAEGLVATRSRRGFYVHDPTPDEIEHIYEIRAILDPAALELAGIPSSATLDALDTLNASIAASTGTPLMTIELDDRWHMELLAGCPNAILLDLIRQFMFRTRALEYEYMRHHPNVSTAVRDHERILSALRERNLATAKNALEINMQSAVGPLTAWARQGDQ